MFYYEISFVYKIENFVEFVGCVNDEQNDQISDICRYLKKDEIEEDVQ